MAAGAWITCHVWWVTSHMQLTDKAISEEVHVWKNRHVHGRTINELPGKSKMYKNRPWQKFYNPVCQSDVQYNDYLSRNLGTCHMRQYKTIPHKKTHNIIQRSRENWMQPEETDSEMALGDKEESEKDWTLDECSIIELKRLRSGVCVRVWAAQNRDTSQAKDQEPHP